jgi:hypothetical protein
MLLDGKEIEHFKLAHGGANPAAGLMTLATRSTHNQKEALSR